MQTRPIVEPGLGSFTFDKLVECSPTTQLEEKLLEALKSCAGYRKAERERCARMAETMPVGGGDNAEDSGYSMACEEIAAKIRGLE